MKQERKRNIETWAVSLFLGISLFISLLVFLILSISADISNFSIYTQYNNLAGEDTQTGPATTTITGTYTLPAFAVLKFCINRRLDPSGTGWYDTEPLNAVPGDTIEYKITWQQIGVGAPADTVVLNDILPDSMTFVDSGVISGDGIISYYNPVITWQKNNVQVGESGEIRYRAKMQ